MISGVPSSSTGPRFKGGRPRIPNVFGLELAGLEEDLDSTLRLDFPGCLQNRHSHTPSWPSYSIRNLKWG